MRFLKLFLVLILAVFSVKSVFAIDIPKYSGHVNDFAKVFSSSFSSNLEQKLIEIESQTTNQIAVVTVNNLQETTIEDYSEQLFKSWGIGQKGKDNGILLLVSIEDRKIRIEVGYGLESIITDGQAGEIIRNQITPEFKKGNYEQGVLMGVDKINQYFTGNIINDEPVKHYSINSSVINFILFFVFFIIPYIFAFLARTKSFYLGGILGGIFGFIFTILISKLIVYGLIVSIVSALIGLVFDFILSKNYEVLKKAGKSTSFWRSRGGFGGGGGWSSGGDSFGGGSSGGGGASGSW